MKIYTIFAKVNLDDYNRIYKYLFPNKMYSNCTFSNNEWYGLYAWTTKKSLLDEFLEIRGGSNIYDVKSDKMELTDEDFKNWKLDYIEYKLGRYKYKHYYDNKTQDVEIVTTKNEYTQVVENSSENFNELLRNLFNDAPLIDYKVFNDDIIKALDCLDYTSFFISNYGTDDECDNLSWSESFSMTILGKPKIPYTFDEVNLLTKLYSYMFYGHKISMEVS